ncbi:ATP-binding protein [Alkalicoccobacillus murimartini]|uniref:histidine kinase n=1 Tax=Alkalicoccobacillus murimartini TaxID=171685 RepID=A0ABT9YD12_9BACI|nr:ATP-binding protein [Alkalicoccobacillus murimartini]MDQ0205746.1 signal transduction histidine kinase/CheY-like chemotaxis protein/HAMP domain-containing protein [Alkalicoccobacillus murimartini]
MKTYFKKSLNRQLLSFMAIIMFLTLFLGTGLLLYVSTTQSTYIDNREKLVEKQDLAFQIDTRANQLVIHSRGYFAFQSDNELASVNNDLMNVKQSISEFLTLDLSQEELVFIEEVQSLLNQIEGFMPIAIDLIDNGNQEELRELGVTSGGEVVNELTYLTSNYLKLSNEELASLSADYTKVNNIVLWMLFGFIITFIGALFLIIRRIFTKIGKPLSDLTLASEQLASGKDVHLVESKREDEVGILSRTFNEMVYTLQDKEEELIAQNEELISQQEELENQQFKLRSSLEETEKVRLMLEKYNRLNHFISVTLDEQELLDQIVQHMSDIYPVDRMGLILLKGSQRFALRGISENIIKELSRNFHDGIGVLLKEKKASHQVKRKSSKYEQGIAEHEIDVYDLYVPVYSSAEDLKAVFCATRVGTEFTEKEREELQGVMSHIAIAIEKVMLYEQTENDRQVNQDIIDNVNEGIQFIDRDGTLLRFNELFKEMVNLSSNEDEGNWNIYEAWKESILENVEEPKALGEFFDTIKSSKTEDIHSMKYKLVEGSRMIEVYAEPVYKGEQRRGTILVHRDITKEYEVDKMKSELVSTVSHELRTPLSSILGFTELMIERDLKPARKEKYLQTIHKEANRLTNLINDFLDLQRMESNVQTYNKKSVDLKELIIQVIAKFEPTYQHHQFMVRDLAAYTYAWADPDRMEQVLTNLISNAVKFSPDGGKVELVLFNHVDILHIHVNDEGLGIPEVELKKLFTKFHRIDNSDRRKIGGTGLGLPITKEIVEAHGGTISVQSESGIGSTFDIAIPFENKTSLLPISTIQSNELNRFRVAIIEDDQSLALLLAEELKQSGFEVQHFLNPKKALEELMTQQMDAVVVDLMLGDEMDGWDFIQALKQSDHTENLPVFISSALNEVRKKAEHYGVSKYLTKPYPPHELSTVIKNTLSSDKKNGQIVMPEE